jgi:hypothetical protein
MRRRRIAGTALPGDPQVRFAPIATIGGRTPIGGFSMFKRNFDETAKVTGWTLHDLRRTARLLMSRAGVPSDHAERCLGRVLPGVRGTYDRHAGAGFVKSRRGLPRRLACGDCQSPLSLKPPSASDWDTVRVVL